MELWVKLTIFDSLQKQQFSMDDKNKKLQKKLEEILPESIKDEGNNSGFIETRNACHQVIDGGKITHNLT